MVKKFSLFMAAVAVLAFAIPALASASPTATGVDGKSLPVGTEITATAITTGVHGTPKLTSTILGTIECATLDITGTLTVNSGGTVTGNSGGAFTSTTCTNKGNPVSVTSIVVNDLVTTVSGKATVHFTSVIDVAGLTCTFTGTNIPGTYTLGTDILTFNKAATVDGSPAGCGNATFDGEFTLEYYTPGTSPKQYDPLIIS